MIMLIIDIIIIIILLLHFYWKFWRAREWGKTIILSSRPPGRDGKASTSSKTTLSTALTRSCRTSATTRSAWGRTSTLQRASSIRIWEDRCRLVFDQLTCWYVPGHLPGSTARGPGQQGPGPRHRQHLLPTEEQLKEHRASGGKSFLFDNASVNVCPFSIWMIISFLCPS